MEKELKPWGSKDYNFTINSKLEKDNQKIKVTYNIVGDPSNIIFPVKSEFKRKDDLWKDTCFELFLLKEDGQYFEINFSPSKEYNIYKFKKYREEMSTSEELVLNIIKNNQKQIVLEIDIFKINIFKFNICSVINSSNQLSYWSIYHQESPDFHLEKNFINFV